MKTSRHLTNLSCQSVARGIPILILALSSFTSFAIEIKELPKINKYSNGVFAVSHDGNFMVTGSEDSTLRYWNVSEQRVLRLLEGRHRAEIRGVSLSEDLSHVVACDNDGGISVSNLNSGNYVYAFKEEGGCRRVAIRPNTTEFVAATGRWGDLIRKYDWNSLQRSMAVGNGGSVMAFAYSPDGRYLAVGEGTEIEIYYLGLEELVRVHQTKRTHGQGKFVSSLRFLADGRLISTAGDLSDVIAWDLSTAENEVFYSLKGRGIAEFVMSPDECLALISTDVGTSQLIDLATSSVLVEEVHPPFAFSGDGRYVFGYNKKYGGGRTLIRIDLSH